MLKEVAIEIIQRCSNRCIYCSTMSHSSCDKFICYEKLVEVISDLKELEVKSICLSGGEPLLHNRLLDIVKFITGVGMSCTIYTSGIVYNKLGEPCSISKEMFELLSFLGVKLIFNIESSNEEHYNRIMGTTGYFGLMQESVRNAVTMGIVTEANFVPNAINYRDIPDTVAFCKELGVSKINFLGLIIHGRAQEYREALELSEEDYADLKVIFNNLKANSSISIRIGVPLSKFVNSVCPQCEAGRGKLSIDYNGCVYPCEVFKNMSLISFYSADSIYNDSIIHIYNSSLYLNTVRELRRLLLQEGRIANETCIGQCLIYAHDFK